MAPPAQNRVEAIKDTWAKDLAETDAIEVSGRHAGRGLALGRV